MPQNQPSSFIPDSFVPDDDVPSSFVPESFVPDEEPEEGFFASFAKEHPTITRLAKGLFEDRTEEWNKKANEDFKKDNPEAYARLVAKLGKSPMLVQGPELTKIPGMEAAGEWVKEKAIQSGYGPIGFVGSLVGDLIGGAATAGDPRTAFPGKAPIPEMPPGRLELPPAPQEVLDRAARAKGTTLPTGRIIAGPEGNAIDVPYRIETGEIVSPDLVVRHGADVGIGRPTSIGSAMDTGELAEQARLRDLNYGAAEQIPGGSLTLPPEAAPIPPVSGDTRLGFNPQSEAELPYPLNVVPNMVRPRAVQAGMASETQMPILDRLYDPEAIGAQGEVPVQTPPVEVPPEPASIFGPTGPRVGAEAITDTESLLKAIEKLIKSPTGSVDINRMDEIMRGLGTKFKDADWYKLAAYHMRTGNIDEAFNTIKQFMATQESPVAKSITKTAIESGSPEIAQAATSPEFIKKFVEPTTRNTPAKHLAAATLSSIDTELTKQSFALGELAKLVQTDSAIRAGTWMLRWDKIVNPLSDTQFSKLVKAIEGKVKLDPVRDGQISRALREYQVLDQEVSRIGTESGMGLRSSDGTKMVPWQPHENYWPHKYTEEFFAAMDKNPTDFRARLVEDGKSPLEIDAIVDRSKRFGERLIDPQHGREANLPGYRVDKNVYREHLDEMARRTVESEKYGPMDLADKNSPLMNLVRETNNPAYTEELMKKLLDRGPMLTKLEVSANRAARKLIGMQAWMHLGTAALSNPNTIVMPALQTNAQSFAKGLVNTVFKMQQTGEFAQAAGATQNIFKQIFARMAEGHTFSPSKVYGLDAQERFMRTLSAETGRIYAKQLFMELKDNPGNMKAAQELRRLILEDPKSLVKQTELTALQEKRAAFRVAELSQGLAAKQNLPQAWTGSGVADLLTLFHKYQFAQTKIMKDLIKANPVKATLALGAVSQVAGEVTGDAKALLRGTIKAAWSNDANKIQEEIFANRGKYYEDKFDMSPTVARVTSNLTQSFMLGMFADLLEMMGGTGSQAMMRLLGSTVNDVAKVWNIGNNLRQGTLNAIQGEEAPQLGNALEGATSMLPIVGPPIASEMRLNEPQ